MHDIEQQIRDKLKELFTGRLEHFTRRRAHQERGPEVSDKILRELKVDDRIRNRVNHLISVHHREDIDDEELKLLIKADKI